MKTKKTYSKNPTAKRIRAYRRKDHKNKFVDAVSPIEEYFDDRTYETTWTSREWEFGEIVGASIDVDVEESKRFDSFIYRIGEFHLVTRKRSYSGNGMVVFLDTLNELLSLYKSITVVGFDLAHLDQTLSANFKWIVETLGLHIPMNAYIHKNAGTQFYLRAHNGTPDEEWTRKIQFIGLKPWVSRKFAVEDVIKEYVVKKAGK